MKLEIPYNVGDTIVVVENGETKKEIIHGMHLWIGENGEVQNIRAYIGSRKGYVTLRRKRRCYKYKGGKSND